MKSKSKDLKKTVPAREVSLKRVLTKNKAIQNNVEHASNKLNSINKVLNHAIKVNIPVQTIEKAITQNEYVEHKVATAADDLQQVNLDLANQVDERVVIESELADTKTDLADAKTDLAKVRDDLSKSQTREEATRKITFQDALTEIGRASCRERVSVLV
jgi:diguanylate cyclase